jgi:hypothetical protein
MLREVRLDRFALSWRIRVRVARIAAIVAGSSGAEGGIVRGVRESGTAVWGAGGDFWGGGVAFGVSVGGVLVVGVGGGGDYVFFVLLEGVPEVAGGGVGLKDVYVHVVVGLADGGVGGAVGPGLVVGGGGGLGGCSEAGETEGGGWPVGIVVVVGG